MVGGMSFVRVGSCLKRIGDGDWRQVLEESDHVINATSSEIIAMSNGSLATSDAIEGKLR